MVALAAVHRLEVGELAAQRLEERAAVGYRPAYLTDFAQDLRGGALLQNVQVSALGVAVVHRGGVQHANLDPFCQAHDVTGQFSPSPTGAGAAATDQFGVTHSEPGQTFDLRRIEDDAGNHHWS